MQPHQARKIQKKSKNIDGWFSHEAAMLFAWIDEIQKSIGIRGDIFEIGCHHGKSAMLLGAMSQSTSEALCVCDLFDDQGKNLSKSGTGNLEKLKQNLSRLDGNLKLKIFPKHSNLLSVNEIGEKYRFFHIDGGHNYEEVFSDLELAFTALLDRGVVALDDPFRPEWPGVTEAMLRFLDKNKEYCAIIVGFNKLIIVRKEYSEEYMKQFRKEEEIQRYGLDYPLCRKELPFNSCPLQIFFVPTHLAKKNSLNLLLRKHFRNYKWLRNSKMLWRLRD